MRKPEPPPALMDLLAAKVNYQPEFFKRAMINLQEVGASRYMPWDELRWRPAPDGLTPEEWWLISKVARNAMKRWLPLLTDARGQPFNYVLPDEVLRGIESVDKHTSGRIGVPEPVTHDAPGRTRYVINSLIEEAITSSQLEGAQTTHAVAKDMLRTGRPPRTRDERMIMNNYLAMQRVGEIRHEQLTPALICDIHRTVTAGTLEDPANEGRPQLPGEERVVVEDAYGNVLHVPPPADQLPERLQRLCDFANDVPSTSYVPPVVRAIAIHFMLGYDHPFVDGNGRTARILFYWSMLNQDYWLAEFLPISRLLKKAPGKYARSFLNTEQDEGDLTYFIIFELQIIQRAITDLQKYLMHKVAETRRVQEGLEALSRHFNHRQLALLQHAVKNPHAQYTVVSHARSHNVAAQTARVDLHGLEQQGLLTKVSLKRGYAWQPATDLADLLEPTRGNSGRHRRTRRSREPRMPAGSGLI